MEVILLPRIRQQLSGALRRYLPSGVGVEMRRGSGERGEASWKATRRVAVVRVFLVQVLIDLLSLDVVHVLI